MLFAYPAPRISQPTNINPMPKPTSWIKAFRLRTLPLALASIIMGSLLAIHDGVYSWLVILLAVLTTILLQVLSNLANDYGDWMKGTDNEGRVGPTRAVQSGAITHEQMKKAVIIFASLSLLSGVWLLYAAFGDDFVKSLIFFVLGIAAILAAVKYTVGKGAYGYSGLGDLFVFVFFGLLGVFGAYYLNTLYLNPQIFLPATASGLMSSGVLNLNNMRDIDNDILSGKHTLAAKLGYRKARIYHLLLVTFALIAVTVYVLMNYSSLWNLLYLLTLPLFFKDLVAIFRQSDNSKLDPYLKKLALTTLLFSVLFGVGMIL